MKEKDLKDRMEKKDTAEKEAEKKDDAAPQASSDYHFIQEKIKERPINRKKLMRRFILTAGLALVFGLVACLTFLFMEPFFSRMLSSDQDMVEREEISLKENTDEDEPVQGTIQVESEEGSGIMVEQVVVETPLDQMTLDDNGNDAETDGTVSENNAEENIQQEPKKEIIHETVALEPEDYRQLFRKLYALSGEVEKSLVRITAISEETDWFNENYVPTVQKTGLIVGNNGYEYLILADSESIQDADELRVTFCDNARAELTEKAVDADTGFAIYGVRTKDIPTTTQNAITIATLGASYSSSIIGNAVMAVGNPLGYRSVDYGIVTSDSRSINKRDASYQILTTDIYGSTNANGVLVNIKGQVVGLICQQYNEKGMENLISAYGISSVRKLIEDLSNGKDRSYLGLYVNDIAPEFELPTGVYVSQVIQGSPAMNAGLAKGDIIQMVGNLQTSSVSIYMTAMQSNAPDDEVNIVYFRPSDGDYIRMEATVQLEKME